MLSRFLVVLFQVITLFIMIGVGFALGRLKIVTEKGTKEMSAVLINVATPSIILTSFQIDWDSQFLVTLGTGFLAMIACYVIFMFLVKPLYRKQPEDRRVCLQIGSMYGNVGFMGIPLISAVLGSSNVIYAVLAIAAFNMMIFTHGAIVMGGRKAASVKSIVTNTVMISLIVSVALMLLRIRIPSPIFNSLTFLGNLSTPLSMLVIGAQLSRSELSGFFSKPVIYAASAVKMIILPIITMALLFPFHFDKTFYIAAVILFAAPTGGYTSIFAERYHRDVAFAANFVSLCTLLSIVTLPLAAILAEYLTTLY